MGHVPLTRVCTVTGLTYRQVDHWIHADVLVAHAHHGSTARYVTDVELTVAVVLAELRSLNAPLAVLRRVAQQLRMLDRWDGHIFIDSDGWLSRDPSAHVGWTIDLDRFTALTCTPTH